ncbi:MAG: carboxypeptidase regulatory-like domain-containing protein [Ignavibacteriales bacterium]
MKKYVALLILLSLCVQINLMAQPSAPSNLKADQLTLSGNEFVKLTWDSMKDAGFYIYKKEGAISDPGDYKKMPLKMPLPMYLDYGVQPGNTYSYYVTASNHSGESSPSARVQVTINGQKGEGTIMGKVTDEDSGNPLDHAGVLLVSVSRIFSRMVWTDKSGNYSAAVPTGSYVVSFENPGYLPEFYNNTLNILNADKIIVNNGGTVNNINAALKAVYVAPQYTLKGKVTDTKGNGLEAHILIMSMNRRLHTHMTFGTITDENGNYSVKLREYDSVMIFARAVNGNYIPEYYNNKKDACEADNLLITHDFSGIDFVLEQGVPYNNSISGRVMNDGSNGVRAHVTAFNMDHKELPENIRTVMTDSLGYYKITGLVPGNYILMTVPFYDYLPTFFRYDKDQTYRWKSADVVEIGENSTVTGINFRVLGILDHGYAIIKGHIHDHNSHPVHGSLVYVSDENQNVVAFTTSSEDGAYLINYLEPGKYTVSTEKFNYAGSEQTGITVDYGDNLTKEVPLTIKQTEVTSVETPGAVVASFQLQQNYPNPFNPVTVIKYSVPEEGLVSIRVFNTLGQEIAVLANEVKKPGEYNISFRADGLPSGMYFYSLTVNNKNITKKMMLLK